MVNRQPFRSNWRPSIEQNMFCFSQDPIQSYLIQSAAHFLSDCFVLKSWSPQHNESSANTPLVREEAPKSLQNCYRLHRHVIQQVTPVCLSKLHLTENEEEGDIQTDSGLRCLPAKEGGRGWMSLSNYNITMWRRSRSSFSTTWDCFQTPYSLVTSVYNDSTDDKTNYFKTSRRRSWFVIDFSLL